MTTDSLATKVGESTKKAVILNNRHDRPERVGQFVDVAINGVGADYIFTFGDYEKQVRHEAKKYTDKSVTIVHLGNSTDYQHANGRKLLDNIVTAINERECLLVGAVNIHTPQSQALLSVLEKRNRIYAH